MTVDAQQQDQGRRRGLTSAGSPARWRRLVSRAAWSASALGAWLGMGGLAPAEAAASDRSAVSSEAYPAARRTTTFEYDAAGRPVARREVGFDTAGNQKHVTDVQLTYDLRGYLSSEEARTRTPGGTLMGTSTVTYERNASGQLTAEDRVWFDAAGRLLRRESDTWRTEADGTRLCDTWEFDGDDHQVGTRYTIVTRDQAGRVVAEDESRYDAAGVQTARYLRQLGHNAHGIASRVLFTFDASDDVASRVDETWTYDRLGHLSSIEARFYDDSGALVQTSSDVRTYGDRGRLERRRFTFTSADGVDLRRLDETYSYDASGRVAGREGEWRYLTR